MKVGDLVSEGAVLQLGGATGLNWDATNKRLGIGTDSPSHRLEVIDTLTDTIGSAKCIGNFQNLSYFLNYL